MTQGFPRFEPHNDDNRPPGRGNAGGNRNGNGGGNGDGDRLAAANNRRALMSVGLGLAFAVLVASLMPGPLVAAAFTEICFFGALGLAIVAAVRREPLMGAPVFTGWDRAAMLLFASQAGGLFVDHDAVVQYLEQVQQTGSF